MPWIGNNTASARSQRPINHAMFVFPAGSKYLRGSGPDKNPRNRTQATLRTNSPSRRLFGESWDVDNKTAHATSGSPRMEQGLRKPPNDVAELSGHGFFFYHRPCWGGSWYRSCVALCWGGSGLGHVPLTYPVGILASTCRGQRGAHVFYVLQNSSSGEVLSIAVT